MDSIISVPFILMIWKIPVIMKMKMELIPGRNSGLESITTVRTEFSLS